MLIFITGTRTGVGLALARHLLDSGHEVIGCSRKPSAVNHANYRHYEIDLTDAVQVRKVLANEVGRDMIKYTFEEEHRQIFKDLLEQNFGYRMLVKKLGDTGKQDISSQVVIRLIEAGLLTGYDKKGERVIIQDRLRFDGVGVEYEV
jgi:NAD(P)-dependent dehydrogenase (short-subunit alcohol dehydrogenase family)